MSQVNITLNTNTIEVNTTNNQIVVTDPTNPTTVNIVQPVTTVVEVITPGPQGPQGPQGIPGPIGPTVNTGSFVTTSSFNAFTSSYNTGSFTGSFSGSLFGTASYAINALTASYLDGYTSPFPFTGSALITGSLGVTGSTSILSGSLTINSVNATNTLILSGSRPQIIFHNSGSTNSDSSIIVQDRAWGLKPTETDSQDSFLLELQGSGSLFPVGSIRFRKSSNTRSNISISPGGSTTAIYISGSGNVGIGTARPTSASLQVNGNVFADSYTGSLFGTSSWAQNSLTASFITSSNVFGPFGSSSITSASFAVSSSRSISSSFATSASFATTSSFATSASWAPSIAGGSDTQIQFNSGNTLAGRSSLTFNSQESLQQGFNVIASGPYSHAEGAYTTAIGADSHAEGYYNAAAGIFSHAEGLGTVAVGIGSKTQGVGALAYDPGTPLENIFDAYGFSLYDDPLSTEIITIDTPITSLTTLTATGDFTSTLTYPYRVPYLLINFYIWGLPYTLVLESATYDIGTGLTIFTVTGLQQYFTSIVSDLASYTLALGNYSHAEGESTKTYGTASHAEGYITIASGSYSHAEGWETEAIGTASHAEGYQTKAIGIASHAEGVNTIAQGNYSHAEGVYTIASGNYQHVQGQYNISSSAESAFIIGNGIDINNRSNLVFASGSQFQITGSLNVSGSITGSLFGTSSFAVSSSRSISSSFATSASFATTSSFAVSASWAPNMGGSGPISVTGSTLYSTSPAAGPGFGTANDNSIFLGSFAGKSATSAQRSNFLGNYAGDSAVGAYASNFLGYQAGLSASNAYDSNFLGANAGNGATSAYSSNFFGNNAGQASTSAFKSNFFGELAGTQAPFANNSNFFGNNAGNKAILAYNSNFMGSSAGRSASYANNSNFLGQNAGDSATSASNSNFIGTSAGSFATDAMGSNFFGNNAGQGAVSASYSTLIGYYVGRELTGNSYLSIGSNNIIIGTNITLAAQQKDSINLGGIIFATGSYSTTSGEPFAGAVTGSRVGIGTSTPQFTLDVSGSTRVTNGITVSGSITSTQGFIKPGAGSQYLLADGTTTTGTGGSPFPYIGSAEITGSLLVTGSVQITGSLNVTQGITGSLFGTASWATNAITATTALNGGVTQLLAGPNVTLSPTNGLGQVTISSTSGGGGFNTATGSYGSFYDTTTQTNPVANIPRSMSLNTTDISNGVSVSGSTNPFNTYIKMQNAGVYNIQFSAQLDKTDSGTDEIVIWLRKNGTNITDSATTVTLVGNNGKQVAAWNWFVNSAANDYYQIIWQSADTNVRLFAEPTDGHPGIPSVIVTANRVDQFLSNTGSFSGSFTGAFSGSGANLNSIPASAITGLNLSQLATGSVTASVSPTQFTVSSGSSTELVVTGTGVTLGSALTDTHRVTGSLNVTGSLTATTYNNLPTASVSSSGILSSTDWNTFNNIVLISDGIPGTAVTGGVSLTRSLIKSYFIPANTFGSGDIFEVWMIGSKVNTNSAWYLSTSINTSNSLVGSTEIGRSFSSTATITYLVSQRIFNFTTSTNLRGMINNAGSNTETNQVGTSISNTTFNTAVDNWILLSIYPVTGATADIMNIEKAIIRRHKYKITG